MRSARLRHLLRQTERHVASSLLAGFGVMLLAFGLFAYLQPLGATAGPATSAATPPAFTALPAPPSASPRTVAPASTAPASPSAPSSAPASSSGAVATRVVIPALRIDLPVVNGATEQPGPNGQPFPYCNVAAYLDAFSQPGRPGTTYLYAHARVGMFLPLLTASQIDNGAGMVGYSVLVYTSDSKVYWYSIAVVKRHVALGPHQFDITKAAPGVQQLVLQTSETPYDTGPKLQVLATFELLQPASYAESHPAPHPQVCT
ncbi:MAG: sortase domain-bontaining protein [Candidatus Limnocylindrales bacterium]